MAPLSPYGASKAVGEAYCSAFHGAYGMHAVTVRFSNAFGPRSAHKGNTGPADPASGDCHRVDRSITPAITRDLWRSITPSVDSISVSESRVG